MGKYFNNLLFAGQVKIMHIILDEEETHLHTLIKSIYKQINTIFQQQKSLQAQEKKLERIFQRLLKVTKELETEESIVEKAKANIKCLDTSIDTVHDSLISFLVVSFSVLVTTAKSAIVASGCLIF